MKNITTIFFFGFVFVAGVVWQSSALAEERNWKGGLRLGAAFTTQEVIPSEGSEGSPGPIINAHFYYRVNEYIHVGPMVEFEYHAIDDGDSYTTSLIPVMEVGPGRIGNFEPYATLGIGYNNNQAASDDYDEANPDNSLALRFGAGVDYFFLDWLAINTELAWKSNKGEVYFGEDLDEWRDFNASSLSLLLGARVAF